MSLSDILTPSTHPIVPSSVRDAFAEKLFADGFIHDDDAYIDRLKDRTLRALRRGKTSHWYFYGAAPLVDELCGGYLLGQRLFDRRGRSPHQDEREVVLFVGGAVLCIERTVFMLSVTLIEHIDEPAETAQAVEAYLLGLGLSTEPIPVKSSCYTLLQVGDEYRLHSIGAIESDAVWSNYPDEAVGRFQKAINSIHSGSGGMLLLSGPPGTGKTHLLRAAIHDMPYSVVTVIVPSSTTFDLSHPALLTALLREHKPIVLLLEDADHLLRVRRDSSDPSGVAGLLNFADGILGQLLRVSIIATTNLEQLEIDPALLRPGRLLDRIHLGALRGPDLARVADRLHVQVDGKTHWTLAELYAAQPK